MEPADSPHDPASDAPPTATAPETASTLLHSSSTVGGGEEA